MIKQIVLFTSLFAFSLGLFAQTKPAVKKSTTTVKSGTVKGGSSTGKSTSSKIKFDENTIIGNWQLVDYQYGPQATKRKSLTLCDTLQRWVFAKDSATKKYLVKVTQSENCTDFGFESEWMISGGNLMIKRTKIMGFGGISASGSFLVKEITSDKMILEFQKNKYIFKKD